MFRIRFVIKSLIVFFRRRHNKITCMERFEDSLYLHNHLTFKFRCRCKLDEQHQIKYTNHEDPFYVSAFKLIVCKQSRKNKWRQVSYIIILLIGFPFLFGFWQRLKTTRMFNSHELTFQRNTFGVFKKPFYLHIIMATS